MPTFDTFTGLSIPAAAFASGTHTLTDDFTSSGITFTLSINVTHVFGGAVQVSAFDGGGTLPGGNFSINVFAPLSAGFSAAFSASVSIIAKSGPGTGPTSQFISPTTQFKDPTLLASSVSGGPDSWTIFNQPLNAGTTESATGQFTAIKIGFSNNPTGGGYALTIDKFGAAQVNCFLAGTAIATPDGEVLVEDLRPGDRLLTADGGSTTMSWLGVQPVNVRLSHPAKVNPVCITAGALGDGIPARDLFLSADHAIALDGLLVNAGALVNGQTIYQVRDMPLDGFTYYHVETEGGHELLLAEGVAAESFIDYADTDSFVNGDERDTTSPIPEMDLPRISAARLVPERIRAFLKDRADAIEMRAA